MLWSAPVGGSLGIQLALERQNLHFIGRLDGYQHLAPHLYGPSIRSSGLRQEASSRAVFLLKVTHQSQDVPVDPALVRHVVDQVPDQMDSHAAGLSVLER